MKPLNQYIIFLKIKFAFLVSKNWGARILYKIFITPIKPKIREREDKILKNTMLLTTVVNGKDVSYQVHGDIDKETIILLHGWRGNAGSMGNFISKEFKSRFRIIAINAPGHPYSEGETCAIHEYADVIRHFNEMFQPSFYIAHSFGCAALSIAIKKYNLNPEKLILIGVPNRMSNVVDKFFKALKLSESSKVVFKNYLSEKVGLPVDEAALEDILSKRKKETLIIHDESDKVTPIENALSIASNTDHIKLTRIKHTGHYKILWSKKAHDEALKFLAKSQNKIMNNSIKELCNE